MTMEDALETSLSESAIINGHDFGSGEMNIFIETDEPADMAPVEGERPSELLGLPMAEPHPAPIALMNGIRELKLTKVAVKNYRSFAELAEATFSDGMNAFVGPNNSGKSNLVGAIRMALDSEYDFNAANDVPGQRKYAFPRTTLTFQSSGGSSGEKTLLRYLELYERSVLGPGKPTYASKGEIRLVVAYRVNQETGVSRQEYFAVRGVGDRRGDPSLNEKAVRQFRKIVRFVAVESGQSIAQLLAGKFREILHGVLRDQLGPQFAKSELARSEYVNALQDQLLAPMRDKVLDVSRRLFPEITDIGLIPSVAPLDETLSVIGIVLRDSIESELRFKGTGVAGGVLIALLRYLTDSSKQSLVFALEEPESFLHPSAQEQVRDDLEALAERATVTLIVTTHSPYVVSRSSRAQVTAISKDADGISRVSDTAAGHESHAKAISGLFRDSVIPELLDRYNSIPASAKALLLVEGTTDAQFLTIAATLLGMQSAIGRLCVIANQGVNSLVAQAVLLKAEASQPVWALFDSDEEGRRGRDLLRGRFDLPKNDVLEYGQFLGGMENAESEWLFPSAVMQRFVDEFGEDLVLKSKTKIKGDFRYDFTPHGKTHFPAWLGSNASAADVQGWKPVLDKLVEKIDMI